MRRLRTFLALLALASIPFGAGLLRAEPGDAPEAEPDVTLPMEAKAEISPEEMTRQADLRINKMQDMLRRVLELQQLARKQKDVIKLNCVNDKLLQVKQLLNIADAARNNLIEALSAEDDSERYHQYSKIVISEQNITNLRDEAQACIGEELIFLGPTEVQEDSPTVVDDPTSQPPFDIAEPDVERPGYASPFL